MNLDEAQRIAKHVAKGMDIAGPYFDAPYTKEQLASVIATLLVSSLANAPLPGVPHEEHVRVKRQLAAAEARVAKMVKNGGRE